MEDVRKASQKPSQYVYTLLVYLFVCNQLTSKRPKFCVWPHMTPGKVYECSELKIVVSKKILICKILKIHEKNLNPQKTLLLFNRRENPERFSIN